MELTEMKVSEFVEDLASDKPVPGGGSVSAVSGTMGMALGIMVASLTTGREKYKDHQDLMDTVFEEGEKLKSDLEELINRDSKAYGLVMDAFGLPRETEEEKAKRSEAIHEGLIGAAQVPFEIMEKSLEAMKIIEKMVGKSNANASSDLGVASIQLDTAIKGAWLNVLINVTGMDDERAKEMEEKGKEIMAESKTLSEKIYTEVKNAL